MNPIHTDRIHRDLDATARLVQEGDGLVERSIGRFHWERRGLLGRLTRLDPPAQAQTLPTAAGDLVPADRVRAA